MAKRTLTKFVASITLLVFSSIASALNPEGPELAQKQIGLLLKAYPLSVNSNPNAIGGVYVMLWACDYQVGSALITITITTGPGDPMPCKRKVMFQ